ncbi:MULTISPECIES: glycosyltransferase family 1 protein [Ectobacillus]|uniref:glycosyltransferase family 1 protein n=1 Tax=Ectobacillus TaxID=2837502 RepID=UPI000F59FCB0|nr:MULTISPECIES: glycosyltransferase family 1 protein [Ectobacillus]UOY92694.1 glycosyltransferase family 1 protein [Ectobacillus sp. JY-23]
MKPIRILQVVTVMNRGGLETMLMNYYRKVDRRKIQFDFMVHRSEEGHYDREITSLGGRIYRMPAIKPGNYRKYFRMLAEFFKEHTEYEIVHAHNNENSSFVLRAAKRAGVKCRIAHSHLSDLGFDIKLPFRLYARMVMKGAPNQYFACSERAGTWLFGKHVSHIQVLNNAVDVAQFSYNPLKREEIRSELQAEEKFVIGHVGRFNRQKNHEFLIDIFAAIHKKNENVLLVLIGDGELRPSIQEKVRNLGLEEHVRFLGVREDIANLLQGFDLFLFPSLFEGLPVVLVEAQAAGLPCVVSNNITTESNVTGIVQFKSLKESADKWAQHILSMPVHRFETARTLKETGYDTTTMSQWLSDYYVSHYSSR